MRASSARRSAAAGRNAPFSAQCAQCGGEFSTASRSARYCSDACRKKGLARADAACKRRRRLRERDGTDAAPEVRRCRVCSAEFELGRRGGARNALYCSQACRAEHRRACNRRQWAADKAAVAEAEAAEEAAATEAARRPPRGRAAS